MTRSRPVLLSLLLLLLCVLSPGVAWAWAAPAASLQIRNDRLIAATLVVDGRSVGQIPAESSRDFSLEPGSRSVRLYVDRGQPVVKETLVLHPGEREALRVPPWEGRLEVRNRTGRDGRLFLDGQDQGPLLAGAERRLVREPGTVLVELRDGVRLLDEGRSSVQPGLLTVFVAEQAPVAELLVSNPLPIPVLVGLGDRAPLVLQPGERRRVEGLAPGTLRVDIERLDGREIRSLSLRLEPWEPTVLQVPVPGDGLLRLVNRGETPVEVLLDGRVLAYLGAGRDQTLGLPTGRQRLVLREVRTGRVLGAEVLVEPFDTASLRFDLARHSLEVNGALVSR